MVRKRGRVNNDEDEFLLDPSFGWEHHNAHLETQQKENQQKTEKTEVCVFFFLSLSLLT